MPAGAEASDHVPELLDHVLHLTGGVDRHHELHSFCIRGRDRTDHGAAGLQGLEPGLERSGLAELGSREGGIVLDQHDGGDLLGVPEFCLPVLGRGGFRPGRQERGLVVGGDFAQPAEGGAADAGDRHPGEDQQGRDEPAQPERDSGTVERRLGHVSFGSLPWEVE